MSKDQTRPDNVNCCIPYQQVLTRGTVEVAVGNVWSGGGKSRRGDGAMFGNEWLPNIAIIINPYFKY